MLARALLSIVTASAVALSPAISGADAAVRSRGRQGPLRRGPGPPVASRLPHQDHDGLLVFEAIREGKLTLETKIGCSELAHSQPPSKVGLPVGAEMTVETALQALILKSANDVAVMLAEAVAGSQEAFVARMNATATRLGMTRTVFANANGLPAPEQVTTARDLAKLTLAVLRDYPELRQHVVDGRDAHGQAPAAVAQRAAGQLRRRRRHQDRLHLRQRLQHRRQRHPRRAQAGGGGAGRGDRPGAQHARGQSARAWFPDARLESRCSAWRTLDTMPVAADAKGVVSIRHAVISWACGTGRRRTLARSKRKREKAVAAAKAKTAGAKARPASRIRAGGAAKTKAKPPGEKTSATDQVGIAAACRRTWAAAFPRINPGLRSAAAVRLVWRRSCLVGR